MVWPNEDFISYFKLNAQVNRLEWIVEEVIQYDLTIDFQMIKTFQF